jgi:hypothetical protein
MTTEAENNFFERIHCNFPYHDREECFRLIEEATTLSADSIFKVIEEVCRLPKSEEGKVSITVLEELLSVVKGEFNHPLRDLALDAAFKMIHGQEVQVQEASEKMEIIRKYSGQYSALSILYFSCNDEEQKLENLWDSIISEWKNNGT